MMNSLRCVGCLGSTLAVLVVVGCNDPNSSANLSTSNGNCPLPVASQYAEIVAATDAVSDRVDEMFADIDNAEVQNVYDNLAAPDFREAAPFEEFDSLCERLRTRLGKLQSKSTSRTEVNPVDGKLIASATYEAEFENGYGLLFVIFQKNDDQWQLLRLNVNSPVLLDDPSSYQQPTELYVENSKPVAPGTVVDLWDNAADPPHLLLEHLRVVSVRWKVPDPSSPPPDPASGFVTLALKPEQVKAIGSTDLAVRPRE